MRALVVIALLAGLTAEDTAPVAAPESVEQQQEAAPDPTAAVVAEGRCLYRQRDLEALVMIAQRHARNKLTRPEVDQLRRALVAAFTAREALVEALAGFPAGLEGQARDALVLDLLNYRAEPAPAKPLTPEVPGAPTVAPIANADPVIVRMPLLVLPRTLDGFGRRTLSLGLAFRFPNPAVAKACEAQSALVQDAVLAYLHQLPAKAFAEPDHAAIKVGLGVAINSVVPGFPADAVLIPELDVSAADKPAAP